MWNGLPLLLLLQYGAGKDDELWGRILCLEGGIGWEGCVWVEILKLVSGRAARQA